MAKYIGSKTGLARMLAKHEGNLIEGVKQSLIIKGYRYSFIRLLARCLFKDRTPKRWIFVLGCYNSGTKLLTTLLSRHPDVAVLPQEGRFLTDAFPDLQANGWKRMMYANREFWGEPCGDTDRIKKRATHDWSALWSSPKRSNYLEKSICNATRVPWLRRTFTENGVEPVFIAIVRNGYCVAESVRSIGRPTGQALELTKGRYSLEMAAEQWVAVNSEIVLNIHNFNNTKAPIIRLEDLVNSPKSTMSLVYEALGLSIPPMDEEDEILITNGHRDEVRSNLNEKRLANLTKEDNLKVSPILQYMMNHFNYPMV